MVIIMKPGTKQERIQTLVTQLEQEHGVKVGITNGVGCSILGLVGDTTHIDMDKLSMNDDVERVMRVQEPYKKGNRKFHPEDTLVDVCGVPVGGGHFTVIAGPCSVESREQIIEVAQDVKDSGAALMRGCRRAGPAAGGKKGHRPAHCHRADESQVLPAVRGEGGPGADRRPEHAELRPAQGGRQDVQARAAQAGAGQQL